MTTADIMKRMILFSNGDRHDVEHFLKVTAYARTIGLCEGLDPKTLRTLEIAAIVHDIACPLCREKYGNTNGKAQEREGIPLVREFFAGTDLEPEVLDRVAYLVGHHHTLGDIDGLDYQILIEADSLVNASESQYPLSNVRNSLDRIFRTGTGRTLLRSLYLDGAEGDAIVP